MTDQPLQVLVNGNPRGIPHGCTLTSLIGLLGLEGKRVAIAVNREVVPRSSFGSHIVCGGDRVEILEAVGGS